MKRHHLALAVPVLAVALAACGDDNGSSGGSATYTPAPSSSSSTAQVTLESTSLGKVLADGSGRTLYLFEKDKGPKSTCFGACAAAWPPLTTSGKPKAGSGVSAAKLGTSSRGSGEQEVTYNGHPLYTYAGDSGPGQTSGQDLNQFGAAWYVLSAAGQKVEQSGS